MYTHMGYMCPYIFFMLSITATAANFHNTSQTIKLVLRKTNQLCKIQQPSIVQWAKDLVRTPMKNQSCCRYCRCWCC